MLDSGDYPTLSYRSAPRNSDSRWLSIILKKGDAAYVTYYLDSKGNLLNFPKRKRNPRRDMNRVICDGNVTPKVEIKTDVCGVKYMDNSLKTVPCIEKPKTHRLIFPSISQLFEKIDEPLQVL